MELKYNRDHLEWRPIKDYECQYEVYNYGDFHVLPYSFIDAANRHITREEKYFWSEELKLYGGSSKNAHYLGIHLGGMKKSYAHILAAKEFVPNPRNKPEINHKDGVTNNNYCGCKELNYQDSNLEWVTRKENMQQASENNLIDHLSDLRKYQCSKNREKIDYNKIRRPVICCDMITGEFVKEYASITEAAKDLGIGTTIIGAVAKKLGNHKTAKGYNWIYKDEYDSNKLYPVIINQHERSKKKVAKCLNGIEIERYESIKDAAIKNNYPIENYIGDVCNNKRKTYKGYEWKFV